MLFSDPWPKKKHAKNRVIQDEFLEDVVGVLAPGGRFIIKTDDQNYAEWIRERLDRCREVQYSIIENEDPEKKSHPENATEFETIWRQQGKKITMFECRKN